MTQLRYAIVDVFAEAPLQGNPAAIVFDADVLSGERMQAIAREFNLSETAFIRKPQDAANTAHVRIFTPTSEVPFAGHPNIGAAFALSYDHELPEDYLTFEEEAGLVQLRLDRDEGKIVGASLIAPQVVSTEAGPSVAATAATLSLTEIDLVPSRIHPSLRRLACPSCSLKSRLLKHSAARGPICLRLISSETATGSRPCISMSSGRTPSEHASKHAISRPTTELERIPRPAVRPHRSQRYSHSLTQSRIVASDWKHTKALRWVDAAFFMASQKSETIT